jgi:2-keto-4-pentenoate hydratase
MLAERQIQEASDLLYRLWQEGRVLPALPEPLRPRTRAEGYAIQACLERRSREPLLGWKVAATSEAGQRHINVDGPLAGRLLAERAFTSGHRLSLKSNRMRVAEAEFAFRFARTLPARSHPYETAEVLDAVASLHPAIEVPDSRYEDFTIVGAAQLIADNACGHDFILGSAAPSGWRAIDLARHTVSGSLAGRPERQGSGANVLGDPRIALTWLVNELSGLGIAVHADQVVTTGTCLVPLIIGEGDRVTADFGALGKVTAEFAA